MTVPMVIGCILLGLLVLLLLLPAIPVFVRLTFYGELQVTAYVIGIPVYRFSSERDEKQPEAPEHKRKKNSKPSPDKPDDPLSSLAVRLKKDGVGAALECARELAQVAAGTARRVLAALTVDKLLLRLFITGEDAAATAQNTGKVCAMLYPSLTAAQSVLRIRKRVVTVTPDFLAAKGKAEAEVLVHAVPYRLLWAAMRAWFAYKKWNDHLHTNITEEEKQHG